MFELDTTGQTVYAANNIFYNAAATSGDSPTIFEFSAETGNINFLPTNWVSPGWLASESAEGGTSYDGTITGTSTFFSPKVIIRASSTSAGKVSAHLITISWSADRMQSALREPFLRVGRPRRIGQACQPRIRAIQHVFRRFRHCADLGCRHWSLPGRS